MKNLDTTSFDEAIAADQLTVVDFWAGWCMPCKLLAPVLEEVAGEMEAVAFAKVDIDANPALAGKYRVDSIPTLILFRAGKEIGRTVGLKQKAQLKQEIESYLVN